MLTNGQKTLVNKSNIVKLF